MDPNSNRERTLITSKNKQVRTWDLPGTGYATTCPECGLQGATSLEQQTFHVDWKQSVVTIENGFDCGDCCHSWWQTIIVEIGDVMANHAYEVDFDPGEPKR